MFLLECLQTTSRLSRSNFIKFLYLVEELKKITVLNLNKYGTLNIRNFWEEKGMQNVFLLSLTISFRQEVSVSMQKIFRWKFKKYKIIIKDQVQSE